MAYVGGTIWQENTANRGTAKRAERLLECRDGDRPAAGDGTKRALVPTSWCWSVGSYYLGTLNSPYRWTDPIGGTFTATASHAEGNTETLRSKGTGRRELRPSGSIS